MATKAQIKAFVESMGKLAEPTEAQIEGVLKKVFKKLYNNEVSVSTNYLELAKAMVAVKSTKEPFGELLRALYKTLSALFTNANTKSRRLSQIRKVIREKQDRELYTMSTYDTYFNQAKEIRDKMRTDYANAIKAKNRNKIQIDEGFVYEKLRSLIESPDVYNRAIAMMMAIGARPFELFVVNEYSLSKTHPGWLHVAKLAKQHDTQKERGDKDYTDRPTIILTPQFVIDQAKNIRKAVLDEQHRLTEEDGQLSQNISKNVNRRVKKEFPFLAKEDVRNLSSFMRKIYADLSYKLYADKDRVNYNSWISDVLGHGAKSELTSFSYSYINVKNDNQPTTIKELAHKVEEIRQTVKKIEIDPAQYIEVAKLRAKNIEKPEKWAILERIYSENPKISNDALRLKARAGSRIVNEFMKSKRAEPVQPEPEAKETPEPEEKQAPKQAPKPKKVKKPPRIIKKRQPVIAKPAEPAEVEKPPKIIRRSARLANR